MGKLRRFLNFFIFLFIMTFVSSNSYTAEKNEKITIRLTLPSSFSTRYDMKSFLGYMQAVYTTTVKISEKETYGPLCESVSIKSQTMTLSNCQSGIRLVMPGVLKTKSATVQTVRSWNLGGMVLSRTPFVTDSALVENRDFEVTPDVNEEPTNGCYLNISSYYNGGDSAYTVNDIRAMSAFSSCSQFSAVPGNYGVYNIISMYCDANTFVLPNLVPQAGAGKYFPYWREIWYNTVGHMDDTNDVKTFECVDGAGELGVYPYKENEFTIARNGGTGQLTSPTVADQWIITSGNNNNSSNITLRCADNNHILFSLPTGLAKSGYSFDRYVNSSNQNVPSNVLCGGSSGTYYCIQNNEVLTAQWTENIVHPDYTITLDPMGGTNYAPNYNTLYAVYNGSDYSAYLDSEHTQRMMRDAASITLPTRTSMVVTYNANGGTVTPTSDTVSYTFDGYYSAQSGGIKYINNDHPEPEISYNALRLTNAGESAVANINANTTWYAHWTSDGNVTLPEPERSGYIFDGWYTAATGGEHITSANLPTGSTTLYAHWVQDGVTPDYTITIVPKAGYYFPGNTVITPSVQGTTEIYVCNHVPYLHSDCTDQMTTDGNSIELPQDLGYTTTFNPNGASNFTQESRRAHRYLNRIFESRGGGSRTIYTSTSDDVTAGRITPYALNRISGDDYNNDPSWRIWTAWFEPEIVVTCPSGLTKEGFNHFDGWYTAPTGGELRCGGDGPISYTPAADETLYAHFSNITYTITLGKNGGTGTLTGASGYQSLTSAGILDAELTCLSGATVTLPTGGLTKNGYTFNGWQDSDNNFVTQTVCDSDKTFIAQWVRDEVTPDYTVTIETVESTGPIVDTSIPYSPITVSDPGTTHIYLCDRTPYLNSDCTDEMTANSNPINLPQDYGYSVIFNPNGANNYSGETIQSHRPLWGVYGYKAHPHASSGYEVVTTITMDGTNGYIRPVDGVIDYIYNVSQNSTTWLADFLTVSRVDCPGDLTKDGYRRFDGWYTEETGGELRCSGGDSYTPTENETLYAHFSGTPHTIILYEDGGTGILTGGNNYQLVSNPGDLPALLSCNDGDTVILPTDGLTKNGYIFNGWKDSDNNSVTQTVCDSDKEFTANWVAEAQTPDFVITLVTKIGSLWQQLTPVTVTNPGTSEIYVCNHIPYLNSDCTNEMTETENPITLPQHYGPWVTFDPNGADNYSGETVQSRSHLQSIFGSGIVNYNPSTGGYSSVDGVRVIDSSGYITSQGREIIRNTWPSHYNMEHSWTIWFMRPAVSCPQDLTKEGYDTFNGWFTEETGGTWRCGYGYAPPGDEDETVYAQFSNTIYTITLNKDGGSGTLINDLSGHLTYDSSGSLDAVITCRPRINGVDNNVTLPTGELTKSGYTFNGWNEGITQTLCNSNKSFTAQWLADAPEEPQTASEIKMHQVLFSQGENKVHNLVPVKRDSDDEVGMLDVVTNRFFLPADGGTFIPGPEVPSENDDRL